MVEALRKLASRRVEGLDLLSDEEIIALCRKELPYDLTAFRELLRRYEGLVYNTCLKYIGSRLDAEEVTQDALIQVFHKLHQFEGRSSFKTWLYTIVRNYCYNRISKLARKREGKEAYESYAEVNVERVVSFKTETELGDRVNAAMAKMKEKERELLVMKFVSGLTIQEMAEVLGIGLSAAKMRLYRALDTFKEIYQKIDSNSSTSLLAP